MSGTVLAQLVFVATAGVRRKIKVQLFGDEFMYAISGGAKLNREVGHFFKALEIDILEGYGLTETCVATKPKSTRASENWDSRARSGYRC